MIEYTARLLLQPTIDNMANQIIHQKNIFITYKNINLVLEGFGLNIFYAIGAISLILEITKKTKIINVNYIYAVSSGALIGLFYILAENDYLNIDDIYNSYKYFKFSTLIYQIKQWLYNYLPNDICQLVNNRLNIMIFDLCSMKRYFICNFKTKNQLIDAIIGSICIPGINCSKYYIPEINKNYKWINPLFCGSIETNNNLLIRINTYNHLIKYFPNTNILFNSNYNDIDILCIHGIKDCYKTLIFESKIKSICIITNKFDYLNHKFCYLIKLLKILFFSITIRYLYKKKKNIYNSFKCNFKYTLHNLSILNNLIVKKYLVINHISNF